MSNEELTEEEIKRQEKSIRDQELGSFYGAYKEKKHNQKDVDAINNRTGKNEENVNYDEEEQETQTNKNSSSLKEKEGLKKEDSEKESDSKDSDNKETDEKDKKEEKSSDNKKNPLNKKQVLEDLSGVTNIKNKFLALQLKIKLIIFLGGLFLVFVIIMSLIMAIDNFTSGIVNFFGVPESDTKENASVSEADGLYTNEEYFYDDDGNELNSEDLVNKLKKDNRCKVTIWNRISDAFSDKFKDPCEFMRYLKKHTDGKETNLGLIIGTVFYGFDSQPLASQYDNPKDALDDVPASNHFEAFKKILTENDFINESALNSIINSTMSNEKYTYYTWEVKEEDAKDDDVEETDLDELEEQEKPKKLVGKCIEHDGGSTHYSLDKWKIFMRFGEPLANKYEKIIRDSMAYNSSDEECNGTISDDELLERIKASAEDSSVKIELDKKSVNAARNQLQNGSQADSLEAFSQAADVNTKTKDVFQSYDGDVFDYKNGFAYTHFPYFRAMENKNDGIDVEYDDVFTPKEIETIILEIIDRKSELNDVLLLMDLDDSGTSYSDNLTSVVTGASCGNYLSVKSLDEITVRLTDCNGMFLANVPFDDYIIGVANAEVSNTNDNYVLSEMVAAISYALHRHNNYTKGNVINMRSGTCDQAYCNMNKGCSVVPAPNVCSACSSFLIGGGNKAYPSLYPKYKALYEKASDYLLVSNGTVHNAHYVSSIQNEWSRKANAGMSFTQIMQETYADEGAELIRCSEADASSSSSSSSLRVGSKATTEYPEVSPDYGKYYGFSYNDEPEGRNITMNPEWKKANLTSVSTNCSAAGWNQTMLVNTQAKSKFEDAFKRVCTILTNGVKLKSGKTCKMSANDIKFGGSFVERKTSSGSFSLHAYGLAVDFNYTAKYNINGTIYSPYDSSRSLENYMKFVEAIGGDEEDCRNVNYILWKYAFEPAGFNWGGNWGRNGNSATYDGMHFEVKY